MKEQRKERLKRINEHLRLMSIHRRLIRGELNKLKEYGERLENLIQNEKKQFNIWFEQETSNLDEEEQLELSDIYCDEYYTLSEVFPNTFRASLFITCYALLEHQLITICNSLKNFYKYKLSVLDCQGKGIDQANTYLKKFVGIDFPDQSINWQTITKYRNVRNKVVHNGGFIKISYKLTKQSYDKLKNDGLAENIISLLRNLKDKPYKDEYNFLKAIDKVIGSEQTDKHKSTILKSAIIPNDVDIYKFIEKSSFLSLNRNYIQFSNNFLHEVFPVLNSFFEEFFSSWELWAERKAVRWEISKNRAK